MECARCESETKNARPVAGYILCNHCNMILITEYRLLLADGNKLTITPPPTPPQKTKKQESDEYWARRRAIHEDSQQDNYYCGKG
jgi:hypothetical protein